MAKDFAKKFYSSYAWYTCRNAYMKKARGLCENCLRRGVYRPAEIVHHIIELDPVNINNPEITLNFNNLEAVCRDCHAEFHEQSGGRWSEVNERRKEEREKQKRYTIGPDGTVTAK